MKGGGQRYLFVVRALRFGRAVAVLVGFVLFDKPELHWRTLEVPALAEFALHKAAVAPV